MKVLKIIGIVIAAIITLIVVSIGGCTILGVYYAGDLVKAGLTTAVDAVEQDSLPKLRTAAVEAPVTEAHRDQMAQVVGQLVQEAKAAANNVEISFDEEKMKGKEAEFQKIGTSIELLMAVPAIVQDGKLSGDEYSTWVKYYQARDKGESPERAAFNARFDTPKE
ncbi:MAG: hypothetical protein J0L97_01125 [Alphaproteobacteria bacterium]|nr:hypothetical protein [Alphaproteobacteria bacterium]